MARDRGLEAGRRFETFRVPSRVDGRGIHHLLGRQVRQVKVNNWWVLLALLGGFCMGSLGYGQEPEQEKVVLQGVEIPDSLRLATYIQYLASVAGKQDDSTRAYLDQVFGIDQSAQSTAYLIAAVAEYRENQKDAWEGLARSPREERAEAERTRQTESYRELGAIVGRWTRLLEEENRDPQPVLEAILSDSAKHLSRTISGNSSSKQLALLNLAPFQAAFSQSFQASRGDR